MEEEKKEDQEQNTKNTARFLFNMLVFGSASLVFKMAWNLGLASLFPNKIPQVGFMHALAWLTMLYIVARVVSAGYMAEVERTISILGEDLQEAAKKFDKFASLFSKKQDKEVDKDLN